MKIGWILTGSQDVASARIMGWNPHQWFVDHGYDSDIIYYRKLRGIWTPDNLHINVSLDMMVEKIQPFTHIIFQKVCKDNAIPLLLEAKKQGKKTVYILDDLILDKAEALEMGRLADIVVAGSEYIKKAFAVEGIEATIIKDAYETPRPFRKIGYETDKPKVVWFGSVSGIDKALKIRWLVNYMKYPYDIISGDMQGVTIKWNRFTVWEEVVKRDIVVIPYLGVLSSDDKAKGNNRLTQSMALGMPVICSPLPAYLDIIKQGINGFVAYTESEWMDYLKILKDSKIREQMRNRARDDVIDEYSQETICNDWLKILGNAP